MVITLSGVTGVGKSYFKKAIQDDLGIEAQVIVTTRKMRDGEKERMEKKFVTNKEFEKLKKAGEIVVTFEYLGNKYGYPKKNMQSKLNSVVELHYSIIYQLKEEVKNTFSIYMLPKNLEIAKQKLKERNLPKDVEKARLDEIEEHIKRFKEDEELRGQFDYVFYNDYTEKAREELMKIIKEKINNLK